MKQIALVNIAWNAVISMQEVFQDKENVKLYYYLDSYIQEAIRKNGRVTDMAMGHMLDLIRHACEDGSDGIIITCTMFSKYVPYFQKLFDIPIIGADVAMMEQAGERGGKTALLCTFETTRIPSEELLDFFCRKSGKPYKIDSIVLNDAYIAAQNTDMETHDKIILQKVRELDQAYDQIVLAQMSMAKAVKGIKTSHAVIRTSPEAACAEILKMAER